MPDSPEIGGGDYLETNAPNNAKGEQPHKVGALQNDKNVENPSQGLGVETSRTNKAATSARFEAEKLRRSTVERIAPMVNKAETAGKQLVRDPVGTTKTAILHSRASRLETHEINKPKSRKKKFFNSIGGKFIRIGIEMIPVSGDILAIGQAAIGRDTGGNKLDWIERAMYLAGGAVPLWPAMPFVEVVKIIRHRTEDTVYVVDKIQKGRNHPEIDNADVELSSETTAELSKSPHLQKTE